MMLIKAIGSIIILSSTTAIGYMYSKKYSQRPQYLRLLQVQLQFLETEICYMSNTLLEAFKKIDIVFAEQTSSVFKNTALYLENRKYVNVATAWEDSVREDVQHSTLNNEDAQLLISFGKSLGNSDCENQKRNIRNIISQLKIQEEKAEAERLKNEKLYKNLGVLGGLLITILLL